MVKKKLIWYDDSNTRKMMVVYSQIHCNKSTRIVKFEMILYAKLIKGHVHLVFVISIVVFYPFC